MVGVYIACAFVLGLAARALGMPPLVGFLAAGFALDAAGLAAPGRSGGHRARRRAAHAVHGGDEGAPAQHRARRGLGHRARPSRGIHRPARHPHRLRARHRLGRRPARRLRPRVLQHRGGGEVARREARASRVPRPRRDRDPHRAGPGRHRGARPLAGYGAVAVGGRAARAAAGAAPRPPASRRRRPRGDPAAARHRPRARGRLRLRGARTERGARRTGARRPPRRPPEGAGAGRHAVGAEGSLPGGVLPPHRHVRPARARGIRPGPRGAGPAAAEGRAVLRPARRIQAPRAQRGAGRARSGQLQRVRAHRGAGRGRPRPAARELGGRAGDHRRPVVRGLRPAQSRLARDLRATLAARQRASNATSGIRTTSRSRSVRRTS